MKNIPYGHQYIDQEDIDAVVQVLKSDYLTTGPKVPEFEKIICDYTKAKNAIAVNSGTSALDIAVNALDLPVGSEVITTPFTFAASANCVLYNNCKPIFADIDLKTYDIDPEQIKKKITKKTKAIIYVDYAGQPCKIGEIKEIAEKHDLRLIEDAAHSLGAEYKGTRVGTFADITCFSFHPVKHITTGEGGAVTTNEEKLAERMKLLRNHGIDKTPSERSSYKYDMKLLGRNYRITDFQCALGISQMKKLPLFLKRRQEIANAYNEKLGEIGGIVIPYVSPNIKHAWHLYPILVQKNRRDAIFDFMKKKGIGVNVHYIPTYKFSYYKQFNISENDYPATEEIYSRIMSIPIHYSMSNEDINYVANALKEANK